MNDVVVSQIFWFQTSSDYQAEPRVRTLIVKPETTVAEIFEWSNRSVSNSLAKGDLVLTEVETLQEKG